MNRTVLDLWVGVFVVVGILALMFLALKVGNASETYNVGHTYGLVANFDNIGGLKVRAPVRSAGVAVGRVTKIRLDTKTYQGLVTMEIDRDLPFPKDSSAKILTNGLLGDQYIGLEAGGEDKNLSPGDMITQTQSAVVLENLIGQFLFNKASEAGSPSAPANAPAPAPAKK